MTRVSRDADAARGAASAAAVVLAGGSGTRVGAGVNKVLLPLAGRALLTWSLRAAADSGVFGRLVVVLRPEDEQDVRRLAEREFADVPVELVHGGASRHQSEAAALEALRPSIGSGGVDVVAIHDGARPLASPALFAEAVRKAREHGGAVPVLPAGDVVLLDDDGVPLVTPGALARAQTPQAFRARELEAAFDAAARAGFEGTDTASTVEWHGTVTVQAFEGSRSNIKVTYPDDLFVVERYLAAHGFRVG